MMRSPSETSSSSPKPQRPKIPRPDIPPRRRSQRWRLFALGRVMYDAANRLDRRSLDDLLHVANPVMTDADFMRLAIQAAWQGLKKGEMPFGACIARRGQVVATVHNSARANLDTTAHAEVQAIREASRQLKTLELTGSVMYATCEPCPMCFTACLWAKLGRITYACRIEDAEKFGIRQILISSSRMKQLSQSQVELVGDVLRDESFELFAAWSRGQNRPAR